MSTRSFSRLAPVPFRSWEGERGEDERKKKRRKKRDEERRRKRRRVNV